MDIANKLFSLTLGVEPNKHTLQSLASTLNSAGKLSWSYLRISILLLSHIADTMLLIVLSLADKQKALEQFADTAEAQKFVSQAPIPNPQQQLTQPQIQYIQAARLKRNKRARQRSFGIQSYGKSRSNN